jgi:hypothetical protein
VSERSTSGGRLFTGFPARVQRRFAEPSFRFFLKS